MIAETGTHEREADQRKRKQVYFGTRRIDAAGCLVSPAICVIRVIRGWNFFAGRHTTLLETNLWRATKS